MALVGIEIRYFATGMALSSLLFFLALALTVVSVKFFLIGLSRTLKLTARYIRKKEQIHDGERVRLRVLQDADWKCSAGLLGLALVAFVSGLLGSGPTFTEPSGNIPGAVLLIAIVVFLLVLITLFVRHRMISRALRKLSGGLPHRRSR